jgi:hypothetical protein
MHAEMLMIRHPRTTAPSPLDHKSRERGLVTKRVDRGNFFGSGKEFWKKRKWDWTQTGEERMKFFKKVWHTPYARNAHKRRTQTRGAHTPADAHPLVKRTCVYGAHMEAACTYTRRAHMHSRRTHARAVHTCTRGAHMHARRTHACANGPCVCAGHR